MTTTGIRGGAPVTRRRPGDSFALPLGWQLEAGPFDGRWGTQANRYEYMHGQCRYCGGSCGGGPGTVGAHPRAECLACGTPQCDEHSRCLVCVIGFVGRVPYGTSSTCGYSGCGKPAVAKAPRVGRACKYHLAQARSRGRTLADQIRDAVQLRERGGESWQKLAWFGPQRRYAVRRWHDDGRTGWTVGMDPQGFETAGQADREAGAWNDPRGRDTDGTGWHAERVLLTPGVWAEIHDWEGRATGRAQVARLR